MNRIFTVVLAWLLSIGAACAQQVGFYDLPNSSSLTSPVTNNTVYWDQTLKQLRYYNGSSFVPATTPPSNISATRAPASTDDNTQGWSVGSIWINTSASPANEYICVSNSTGAAVWNSMTSSITLTLPAWMTGGATITNNGTFPVSTASQPANYFLASPSGSSGTLSPRLIVAGDLPLIPLSGGGTNANLTAVAGAVVYSTASNFAYSNVGTAGMPLLSGGTSQPTFGTTGLKYGGTNADLTGLSNGAFVYMGATGLTGVSLSDGQVPQYVAASHSYVGSTPLASGNINPYYIFGNMSAGSAVPSGAALVAQALPQATKVFGGVGGTVSVRPLLNVPSAPVITTAGTAGSTTYTYKIVFKDAAGIDITAGSAAGSTSTGNATLTSSNYNIVTWGTLPTGVALVDVYRTAGGATQGKIASNQTGTFFNDQGAAGDASTAPTSTTFTGEHWHVGNFSSDAPITCNRCRWHIANGNLTINSSNAITVNTELPGGVCTAVGPNANGAAGVGLGAGSIVSISQYGGGGGGNGGAGGAGGASAGGQLYQIEHQLVGSGGASGQPYGDANGKGGNGGGALYCEVSGNVTINSAITANGGNGGNATVNASGGGGGGSGGTISIRCGGTLTIAAVTLSCNGGNGGTNTSGGAGLSGGTGGGGGGRIFARAGGTVSDASTKSVAGGSAGAATNGAGAGSAGSVGVIDIVGNSLYSVRTAP